MVPLINNVVNPEPYLGFTRKLGSTAPHISKRPILQKLADKKRILEIGLGPSTPNQVMKAYAVLASGLTDYQFINCCRGAQDIDKVLNPTGLIWTTVKDNLAAAGRKHSDVQKIIMCMEDTKTLMTGLVGINSLRDKLYNLIDMLKGTTVAPGIFPNLKHIEFLSRFNGDKLAGEAARKFLPPSDFENGISNKLVVEECIKNDSRLNDIFLNDSIGYVYTDGENVRSDGFRMLYKYFLDDGAHIHLDVKTQGDEIAAQHLFDNQKRLYPDYK